MTRLPRFPPQLYRVRLSPVAARALLAVVLGFLVLFGCWYGVQSPARRAEVDRLLANAWSGEKGVSWGEVAWDVWNLHVVPDALGTVAAGEGPEGVVYGGWPRPASPNHPAGEIRVLANRAFVVGYSEALGGPVWGAYRVRDLPRIPRPPARPGRFEVDRRTQVRIAPEDYAASGFDRGHLAPNFAIATRHGAAAQRETFLMSNITPQRPAVNQGLWRDLEQRIAVNYPARYGEVWVFVGPVFGPEPARIRGRIAVPEAFFTIVLDEQDGRLRTLAFLIPQSAGARDDPAIFLTTISDVQRRTGLDFLPLLPDPEESAIEAYQAGRPW